MGNYYDVDKVESIGRKLRSKYDSLSSGEKLVMVLDRTIRKIAVDVSNAGEYDEFYGQYRMGYWLSYNLYAYTPV